jgi:hypothetical protein
MESAQDASLGLGVNPRIQEVPCAESTTRWSHADRDRIADRRLWQQLYKDRLDAGGSTAADSNNPYGRSTSA